MNVDTGELRMFGLLDEPEPNFIPVPIYLEEEVQKELAGKESVIVNMKESSPLVDWAKKERAEKNKPNPNGNRKHRRRMAKESRRQNRR